MSSPILWGPNGANNLQDSLGFGNGSGPIVIAPATPVDPTITATFGAKGSLYLNNSTGLVYRKTDNGSTTNWTPLEIGASVSMGVSDSSSQGIASGSDQVVTWNTTNFDASTSFSSGTTFTAPGAGAYMVNAAIMFSFSGSGGNRQIKIAVNGTVRFTMFVPLGGVSTETPLQINKLFSLSAGDTVTIIAAQSSGSSLALFPNVIYNFFTVCKIATTPAGSSIVRSVSSISIATTLGAAASTDYVALVTGTTTVTLPTAVLNTNLYTLKNAGVATVTVAFTSGQTGDGSSTLPLTPNTSLDLISDNSNWRLI